MTRFRNFLRRFLGVEQFERTTISELNTYRSDVDRWTRDIPGRREFSAAVRRHDSLRHEVEELGILATTMRDALGPIWTTAAGHSAPMALLSTSHLRNILEGGFARSETVQEFAERELERRGNDAEWREREAMGERAPTRDEMVAQIKATLEREAAERRTLRRAQGLPTVEPLTETGRTVTEPAPQYMDIDYAQLEARMLVAMLQQALRGKRE